MAYSKNFLLDSARDSPSINFSQTPPNMERVRFVDTCVTDFGPSETNDLWEKFLDKYQKNLLGEEVEVEKPKPKSKMKRQTLRRSELIKRKTKGRDLQKSTVIRDRPVRPKKKKQVKYFSELVKEIELENDKEYQNNIQKDNIKVK